MKRWFIASLALLALFIGAAIFRGNYEFLFYSATLVVLLAILYFLDRRFTFSALALWGFNLWLLMHLLGGMASIDEVRLYDYIIVHLVGAPHDIFKYDQFVHIYCYVVMAMLVFEVLDEQLGARRVLLFWITVLAASGIGGLNEVVEFAAVVVVGSTGVGGYENTALDLVGNLLGAIIGAGYKLSTTRER